MRYEKPTVVDLNGRAAHGQNPLGCMPGGTVAGYCTAGGDPTTCSTGTGGTIYPGQDCYAGTTPVAGYGCLAGVTADFECSSGGTPGYVGTCTVGPSNI